MKYKLQRVKIRGTSTYTSIECALSPDEKRCSRLQKYAVKALQTSGLANHGWTFGWCNRENTRGLCRPITRTILLSYYHTLDFDKAKNTIRHELAHAFVDEHFGIHLPEHGVTWQACAIQFGVSRMSTPFLRELPYELWSETFFDKPIGGFKSLSAVACSTPKSDVNTERDPLFALGLRY